MVMNHVEAGREAIERLRALAPTRATPVTLNQVQDLVAMIGEGYYSLDQVTNQLGLERPQVIELVVDLGTWLGQSVNAGAGVPVVAYADAEGAVEDVAGQPQMTLFKRAAPNGVVLPPGFGRKEAGRDLSKAVGQIAAAAPDEAMLRRYLMRRYHRIHQVLSFETVTLVHRLAQIGRLGEVDQLVERAGLNTELARVLVEAYDLLDVARQDAVDAVRHLLAAIERGETDPAALRPLAAEARWLHQAAFTRLTEVLDDPTASPVRTDAALAQFRRTVHLEVATFAVRSVAELNDGHVRRLCEREGLRLEGTHFTEAETVRSWVTDAGMQSDADLLVADGIRAHRAGLGELFQQALALRAEGDLAWAEELNDRLAVVARV